MAIFSKASLNKWKKKKSRSVPCSSVPHPIQPSIAFQVPRNTTAGKLRSARRGPRSLVPRRLPTKQGRRPEGRKHNTPEARRRGTYEWHRLLLTKERARAGGQRAATASATARRANPAANATTVAPSSPTGAGSSDRAAPARASTCFAMAVALLCACSKRRRGVHTVPLLACSIRRAALKINAAARSTAQEGSTGSTSAP